MIKLLWDKTYHYKTLCNTQTGEYIRGYDVKFEPFMAEFPHLIDVGIMGSCEHGRSGLCLEAGIECYQNGLGRTDPNMSLADYTSILEEGGPYLQQIALGGAGDPDMHENFEEILAVTRKFDVAPNFTTSGFGMTPEKAALCKKYCGAVAVSMYSRLNLEGVPKRKPDSIPWETLYAQRQQGVIEKTGADSYIEYSELPKAKNYTYDAVQMLIDAGVTTNIHYVLSNRTIDEALLRLKHDGFPKGINAVIFLLHKPVGLGSKDGVLQMDDPRVQEFFGLIDTHTFQFKTGFDSCSIPAILNICQSIDLQSIDTCEGGRFSMYIDANMVALPCSFDNQSKKYGVQLGDGMTIKQAWDSPQFQAFRSKMEKSCPDCPKQEYCLGGCPLEPSIVLCQHKKNNDKEMLR